MRAWVGSNRLTGFGTRESACPVNRLDLARVLAFRSGARRGAPTGSFKGKRMGYASNDTASNDPVFRQQVRQAVITQSIAVGSESASTPLHVQRSNYASQLLNMLTDDKLTGLCRVVASDGLTLPGSADSTVLARVAAIWNNLAGGL